MLIDNSVLTAGESIEYLCHVKTCFVVHFYNLQLRNKQFFVFRSVNVYMVDTTTVLAMKVMTIKACVFGGKERK